MINSVVFFFFFGSGDAEILLHSHGQAGGGC